MEVFLIRHTKVKNEKNICYGQTDISIDLDSFKLDNQLIKNKLPHNFDKVYSSPLKRCKILTKELGYQDAEFDNSLMEMNFGDWEGQEWDTIKPEELNPWMHDFVNIKPPNGENLLDLYARVGFFVESLRNHADKGKVLVVTHAGVIRCFYAYWLQFPLENLFKIHVNYNEVHHFKLRPNRSEELMVGRF